VDGVGEEVAGEEEGGVKGEVGAGDGVDGGIGFPESAASRRALKELGDKRPDILLVG
jgi:hypothetical protein